MGPLSSFIPPSFHPNPCLSDPHFFTSGLDGPSVWELLLSYIVLRRAIGKGKKIKMRQYSNNSSAVQQSRSKTFPPIVVYIVNNSWRETAEVWKYCFTNKRTHTAVLFHVPLNMSVCLSDWALHQACRLCCVCAFVCTFTANAKGLSDVGGKMLFEKGI